jgi:D-glycero-D-manno-heptose 1,7-bisphosphate phosphatase
MILDAANRWHIDLKQSFVVGDTEKDMQAARAAGCASILIEAEYNAGSNSTLRVKNISEAVEYILNSDGGGDA